jgi:hypothetical protein
MVGYSSAFPSDVELIGIRDPPFATHASHRDTPPTGVPGADDSFESFGVVLGFEL